MKQNRIALVIAVLLISHTLFAQDKFYTKTGKISFFSSTSVEDITAVNKSAICLLNAKTGELQFAVLMKGFEFKKALMQEHFNAEYIESDKFPKAEFKGQITNNSAVAYGTDGSYAVTVNGNLTLHGVTKPVSTPGTIVIKSGVLQANATFNVLLADYQITVPKLYRDNISSSIKVTVDCSLEPLK